MSPDYNYTLLRSKRRTLVIRVTENGLEVRAPLRMPLAEIERFVAAKAAWIAKHMREIEAVKSARAEFQETVNKDERARLTAEYRARAQRDIPARTAALAQIMGVQPASVKVGSAKTRWGSCNAKGAVHFSWRLIFAQQDTIDYVIIHELAHLRQLNHSKAFWDIVARYVPDYKQHRARLKDLGRKLAHEGW
ncbi:MAG: M48 family metallopeptidase [Clostridiales Family XIII bacterium]|jgi:predicted metal-dependent hydrolase|nr:M48 family metallopeptidase [Clostridiales Family XIII bacterium]